MGPANKNQIHDVRQIGDISPWFTWLSITFHFVSVASSFASQNPTIDSLKAELQKVHSDTTEVRLLTAISQKYYNISPDTGIIYGKQALVLAESINDLNGLSDAYNSLGINNAAFGNYEASLDYFEKFLSIKRSLGDREGMAKAYNNMGRIHNMRTDYEQALENHKKSVAIDESLGNKRGMAISYHNIGIIYYHQGQLARALAYYTKSLHLKDSLGLLHGMANTYMNIGIIYSTQENYPEALEQFRKSLAIMESEKDRSGIAYCYTNIGNIYESKGDYAQGLRYHQQALVIRKNLGDPRGVARSYNHIGSIYNEQEEFDSARIFREKALQIATEIGNKNIESYSLNGLAVIALKQKKYPIAQQYAQQSLVLAEEIGNTQNIRNAAQTLHRVAALQNDYSTAYNALLTYKAAADSLFNEEQTRKITRIEAEYDFKQEKEALQIAQQQQIFIVEEAQKRTQLYYLLGGLLVSIAIAFFVSRSKNQQRKRLTSIRNRISRDLHDEVGSTLSSIMLYGSVAQQSLHDDPEKTSEMIDLMNSKSSETIDSMSDIVWAIDSDKDSLDDLVSRIRDYAYNLESSADYKINIEADPQVAGLDLNMIQRRNIYLILKEAINNAVKYSKGDRIEARIFLEGKLLNVQIQDNGVGFDQTAATHSMGGNGLINMQQRANELMGELIVQSIPDKGTTVKLSF